MPRNVGDLITADSFNEVVDRFNVLWQDPKEADGVTPKVYTYTSALHTSEPLRQRGWGQPTNSLRVAQNTTILADHYNLLAAHINSGEYHREDASLTAMNYVTSAVDVIRAADMNPFETLMTSYENTDAKFDLGATGIQQLSVHVHSNGGVAWGSNDPAIDDTRGTLTTVQKYTWSDYNDARHFFNSGGQIIVDLEAAPGTFGFNEWDYVFDQIDSVYISAKTTTRGVNGINGTGQHSFYTLTDSYQQIFNAIGFDSTAAGVGGQFVGSGGGYQAYGGREVTMEAKLGMDGTDFCMWVKVILTEDADDVQQVDAVITVESGHITAGEAPDASGAYLASSNGNAHKISGTAYLFESRVSKVPTISTDSVWTYAAP